MKQIVQKFALLVGLACSLVAQEKTPTTPPPAKPAPAAEGSAQQRVRRVVFVRHTDPQRVGHLISGFETHVSADSNLGVVIVSGSPEQVRQAEELIKQIDVPRPPSANSGPTANNSTATPNVEITMHLVAVAAPGTESATKLPTALQPVIQKLESTFGTRGLQLLDTMLLRGRAASQAIPGSKLSADGTVRSMPSEGGSPSAVSLQPTNYNLTLQLGMVDGSRGSRVIGLTHFRIAMKSFATVGSGSSTQTQSLDGALTITADLQEDQPTVIGKGSLLGPDRPVFVILQARVL